MAESTRTENIIEEYPFILLNRDGADMVVFTDYTRKGGISEPKYYAPRFFRSLEVNKNIEAELDTGETHYFSVARAPERGANPNGIYVSKIEKPINLEDLRTQGNVILPDIIYELPK